MESKGNPWVYSRWTAVIALALLLLLPLTWVRANDRENRLECQLDLERRRASWASVKGNEQLNTTTFMQGELRKHLGKPLTEDLIDLARMRGNGRAKRQFANEYPSLAVQC